LGVLESPGIFCKQESGNPARVLNMLPLAITSLPSLQTFKRLFLWEGRAGRMLRGQANHMTYVKQLLHDSCGETVDELRRTMKNRAEWARVSHTTSSSEWLRSLRKWMDGWRRYCFADRRTTHTSGNSSIDTSLIRDIYCGLEVLFETCVTVKFVDDDGDDEPYIKDNW